MQNDAMSNVPPARARELLVGGVSKEDLLERLARNSVLLNDYARALFADERFGTSPEPRRVHVAIVTLNQLGLADGGTFKEIVQRAAAVDLSLCPLEVGPHLRLTYLDQPEGPYLTIASAPLSPDGAGPTGFYLRRRKDGLWLRGYRADAEHVHARDFSAFAFIAPE